MSKKLFGLAFLLVIVSLVLYLAVSRPFGAVDAIRDSTLRVGYSRLRISLPVFVAKEKGIFEKNGLSVELEVFDTAQPLMQALVEGKVDVAGYTALPITFNGMLRSKKDLYFVTAMMEDQSHPISYLLRRKTAPGEQVKIEKISDLRGKSIGILPTIAYKVWLEVILERNGVEKGSYTIQQISPEQQAMTLKTGGVDALFTNDPAATAVVVQGVGEPLVTGAVVPTYFTEPFIFGSFNVSKSWADENPSLFAKLVKSLDEAVAYTNENPAEAKAAMLKYLPENLQSHVEEYADALYLQTSGTSEEAFQSVADLFFDSGVIPSRIDLKGLVVRPSAEMPK